MIKAFHLNGADNSTFNSGRDIHRTSFSSEDDLFGPYSKEPKKSGIYSIVMFAKKHGAPIICEVKTEKHSGVVDSLKLIHSLD